MTSVVAYVYTRGRGWHKQTSEIGLTKPSGSQREVCVTGDGSGEEGAGAQELNKQAAGPAQAGGGLERAGPEQRRVGPIPDDRFGETLRGRLATLQSELVVKNSEHFPCIMDVEKSATEDRERGEPDGAAKGSDVGNRGGEGVLKGRGRGLGEKIR